jgi:hypothetical protein
MLADLSTYIATHAPALMQGDAGIVILCAWTLSTAYLYHYAKSKGAL